jgi:hypothetical protein
MRLAWPSLEHKCSARRNDAKQPEAGDPKGPKEFRGTQRFQNSLLNKIPVDMIVVERGTKQRPPTDLQRTAWEDLIDKTFWKCRTRLVLEMWHTNTQPWSKGPMCKGRTTVWEELGYVARCRTVQATDIGGAIHQEKLIVGWVQKERSHAWKWAPWGPPRPYPAHAQSVDPTRSGLL